MKKNIYIYIYIYIYIKLNHFAVDLKLTQHCKSTILQLKIKKMVPYRYNLTIIYKLASIVQKKKLWRN